MLSMELIYIPNYGFIILYQSNFQNEDIKGTEDKINVNWYINR